MLRFVHIADVHLDTSFRARTPDERRRLIQSGEAAFASVIDLCLEQRVHALLVAGDLFDRERWSVRTEGFLRRQLERVTRGGVQVLIAAGNHDPGSLDAYSRLARASPRVTVFHSARPTTVEVTDADSGHVVGRVTGAGHESPREARNLAAALPPPCSDLPHVALLHTMVEGAVAREHHDRYAPCGLADLRARAYSYWALGHVHVRQRLADDLPAWYPGNLQGRNHRESGAKGALLVSLPDPRSEPEVEFRPRAAARFETLAPADPAALDDFAALAAELHLCLERVRREDPGLGHHDWYLRVDLAGRSPLARHLPRAPGRRSEVLDAWREELELELDAREVQWGLAALCPPVEVERHRGQPHLLGEVLERCTRLRAGLCADPAEVPGGWLPKELPGFDPDLWTSREEYVRALLDGLEEELAERLLDEADS